MDLNKLIILHNELQESIKIKKNLDRTVKQLKLMYNREYKKQQHLNNKIQQLQDSLDILKSMAG